MKPIIILSPRETAISSMRAKEIAQEVQQKLEKGDVICLSEPFDVNVFYPNEYETMVKLLSSKEEK